MPVTAHGAEAWITTTNARFAHMLPTLNTAHRSSLAADLLKYLTVPVRVFDGASLCCVGDGKVTKLLRWRESRLARRPECEKIA